MPASRRVRSHKQYWDSSVFIEFLKDEHSVGAEKKVNAVWALIKEAEERDSDILIVVSTLVLAEVWLWPPGPPGHPYNLKHTAIVEDLFYTARDNVRIVGVTPTIAEEAARLGPQCSPLTVPDLIHVATALSEGAADLFTYDGVSKDPQKNRSSKLLDFDGKLGDQGLRIRVPTPQQIPLG